MIVNHSKIPTSSRIADNFPGTIDYVDCFGIRLDPKSGYSPDYLTALLFTSWPWWTRPLFALRNMLVRPFGLETGGILPSDPVDQQVRYNVGDKAVVFTVIDRSECEIVMAENDRHLHFRTSVCIEPLGKGEGDLIFMTTVVGFHHAGGRLYFIPVKPFHKLLIRSLLVQVGKSLHQAG